MTPTDPITAQVTAAAACAFILRGLQQLKQIPWITEHTHGINIIAKVVLSAGATLGISHAWTPSTGGGGTLMFTIPPLSVIMVGLWHWFGQFSIQHGFGKVLDVAPPPLGPK